MESQEEKRFEGDDEDKDGTRQGQAEVWKLMFAFADSMAVKCALELRIPDIIHSHGSPMSLSEIASRIGSANPDVASLSRVMRLLVRKRVFSTISLGHSGEPLYDLTNTSRWLLRDSSQTLAPMFLMENHPWLLTPWQHLSTKVRECANPFERANGCAVWELASKNPDFNDLFNNGIACTSNVVEGAFVSAYKGGLRGAESLVDVGGGNRNLVAAIVRANWPRIKGINFDLPHVVEKAPVHQGVTHVAGDMFVSIPTADAIVMKFLLHDWDDENCIKILRNCRKAIPKTTGKVILVEVVVQPDGGGPYADTTVVFDLLMMAHTAGGRERTQHEWTMLLENSGFSPPKFIAIPSLCSIVEAFAA